MASLQQTPKGAFKSRQRTPKDVPEDYGRLHGQSHEVKFFLSAGTKLREAKQRLQSGSLNTKGASKQFARRATSTGHLRLRPRHVKSLWLITGCLKMTVQPVLEKVIEKDA